MIPFYFTKSHPAPFSMDLIEIYRSIDPDLFDQPGPITVSRSVWSLPVHDHPHTGSGQGHLKVKVRGPHVSFTSIYSFCWDERERMKSVKVNGQRPVNCQG